MRIGVDLGGTKIEVAALDEADRVLLRRRVPTPGDHAGVIAAIAGLVAAAEAELGQGGTVGIGTVLFAVSIGPLVHLALPLLDARRPASRRRVVSAV